MEKYFKESYEHLEYKLDAPARIFRAATSWLPSRLTKIGLPAPDPNHHEDWFTKSLRIGVPFVLNRFVFRKAGFLKKVMVALLSQTAVGAVTKDRVAGVIDKITNFIRSKSHTAGTKKRSRTKTKEVDYGIPPYSETY
ncbi:hypothetical protein SAMN05216436_101317 [bacterium A37T11]|nr:hypothetical protein SAMN05216436_101317 [bacterium A37T11]